MTHEAAIDKDRGIMISVGDRVHWFEYSEDMIIINGGFGLVVGISPTSWDGCNFLLSVLKDGTTDVCEFPLQDCDVEDLWEDYCDDN